jgi:thioredoxin-like negative regulator of GroEL
VTSTPAGAAAPVKDQPAKPMLLFFYSAIDGSSRRAEGFLAQVLQRRRNHDTFQVTRIDAGKRPDLIERFRVELLPSLLVVDDRRVQARLTRPRGCDQIKEILTPWLR